jgi:hypothetical protein
MQPGTPFVACITGDRVGFGRYSASDPLSGAGALRQVPDELSHRTADNLNANRAYSRARALLAGVRPGHAPRNGYGRRISAHLRVACRSHLAPKIGHGGAAHLTGLGEESRPLSG